MEAGVGNGVPTAWFAQGAQLLAASLGPPLNQWRPFHEIYSSWAAGDHSPSNALGPRKFSEGSAYLEATSASTCVLFVIDRRPSRAAPCGHHFLMSLFCFRACWRWALNVMGSQCSSRTMGVIRSYLQAPFLKLHSV